MTDARFYPLYVAHAGASDEWFVKDPALIRFAAACDGRQPLGAVAQRCGLNAQDALAMAWEAIEGEKLVDVRLAYRSLHLLAANPATAPPAFAGEEVLDWPRFCPPSHGAAIAAPDEWRDNAAKLVAIERQSADFSSIAASSPVTGTLLHRCLVRAHAVMPCRRTIASAGALYPVEIWAAWREMPTDGTSYATYWYDAMSRALVPTGGHSASSLAAAISPSTEIANLVDAGAGVIFICADLQRCCAKYGNRGYRFAIMEAGAVWQNIDLVLHDERLPARAFGGFVDASCAALLGLPDHVVPLLIAFVGG